MLSISRFSVLLLGGLLGVVALPAAAQTTPLPSPDDKKVYTYVEQMPQPPGGGGGAAVVALIQQRVTYPRRAELVRAEGRVFVSFTVAPSGMVEDVAVVKGFRPDCDSAVVQAVQRLPRFEPGRQMGRAVPVRFTVPVTFRLQAQQPVTAAATASDSTRLYTYVQYMPLYRGEAGTQKLTEDLRREFQAACALTGCVAPTFPLFVTLVIGPSGVIHDVKSVNNMPAISQEEFARGIRGIVGTRPNLQPLPAACEAALLAAGRKLPRLKPGSLNGRLVAVSYTLKLNDLTK